jgi:hypothetical protein
MLHLIGMIPAILLSGVGAAGGVYLCEYVDVKPRWLAYMAAGIGAALGVSIGLDLF